MRRVTYILITLMLISAPLFSQGIVEALKFSDNELHGTARSMGMGGAFGALGGDLTGVSINPAGIGVYRSSEISGTFGLQRNNSKVGDIKKGATDFNVHSFGFVGYFPLRNEAMPLINFGFSQNRQKNFNRNINAAGIVPSGASRMLDFIAESSYGSKADNLVITKDYDPFLSDEPWLAVLGFNSELIDPHTASDGTPFYTPIDTRGHSAIQEIRSHENGHIDTYDFTVGTSINDVLNIGVSLNISDLYHHLSTEFLEDYDNGNGRYDNGGYTLGNVITTTGSGIGAKLGLIYKPIHELRLGLSYHTPTVYTLTESFEAFLDDDMSAYINNPEYESGETYSALFNNYYDLRTPSKWVMSAAAVLGSNFIFSADYELTDYRNTKLKVPSGNANTSWYDVDNNFIKNNAKIASTIRLGAEYRFDHQLSARLGYAWKQNPYDSELVEFGDMPVAGSNTIHRIEGDTNYYTAGVGYRFTKEFYMDFAMVYQTQKDDLYPFPNLYFDDAIVDAAPFTLKNNSVRGLITFGYRF